jgi:DNA-binding IclR family transcriptional regulator
LLPTQARGRVENTVTVRALLDHLTSQSDDIAGLAGRLGLPVDHVRVIMVQLAREGLVMPVGGGQWAPTPEVNEAAREVDLDRALREMPARLSIMPGARR